MKNSVDNVLVPPPKNISFALWCDPLEFISEFDSDFYEDNETDLDKDIIEPLLESPEFLSAFIFGDLASTVRRRRFGHLLRDSDYYFRRHAVKVAAPGVFEVEGMVARKARVRKSLQWSAKIGYLWVLFKVVLDSDVLSSFSVWRPVDRVPETSIWREYGLDTLHLPASRWESLADLVSQLKEGEGLVSFANEGTLACLFASSDRINRCIGDRPNTSNAS